MKARDEVVSMFETVAETEKGILLRVRGRAQWVSRVFIGGVVDAVADLIERRELGAGAERHDAEG